MRKIARNICYAGLAVLLLAMFLLLVPSFSQTKASARTAQIITHVRKVSSQTEDKVIVVSLSRQWLYAYDNGSEVFNAAVMTGRPALASPAGTYHIFAKLSPTTFYSPFPRSSSYWYPPTHISYALEWKPGFFLHDSWWHSVYGPGTNGWHYDPVDGWQWGSHGCVAMALKSAAWLYAWAPIGTTVRIEA